MQKKDWENAQTKLDLFSPGVLCTYLVVVALQQSGTLPMVDDVLVKGMAYAQPSGEEVGRQKLLSDIHFATQCHPTVAIPQGMERNTQST